MSACYVGVAPCGHFRMAVVDNPEHAKDTAKAVSLAIRRGLEVKRVSALEARSGDWGSCDTCAPKRKAARA